MQQTSEVISKEQCPQCAEEGTDTSCDNLVTFSSGVQHCHRHGTIGKTESNIPKVDPLNLTRADLIQGEYPKQAIRGISAKTCEFYGYQINTFSTNSTFYPKLFSGYPHINFAPI